MMKIAIRGTTAVCLSVCTAFCLVLGACSGRSGGEAGRTEILRWKDGKKAAISITWDDGSINQFRVGVPLLEKYGFRGTFFINTGHIPGSKHQARFIGRPVEEIIRETETIPTGLENLFERGSAVGFLGYEGMMAYHSRAGSAVDAGDIQRACDIIDEAYALVRSGEVKRSDEVEFPNDDYMGGELITWEEIREIASRGHEFGNHTISHPRLAILDEPNLLWELEMCREDILHNLGPGHTFSCECPYGTENERVMEYAFDIHPALRNRMPEPYLAELNRASDTPPGAAEGEYVQWQRGPLSGTPLERMKSWVDTCLAHDHLWLVLVFHGVEGVGWEPVPEETLERYFRYMDSSGDRLWVGTFREVTKYMRERMSSQISVTREAGELNIELTHRIDPELYDMPLTLRTLLPDDWEQVIVSQGGETLDHTVEKEGSATYITYNAAPNRERIVVRAPRLPSISPVRGHGQGTLPGSSP